MTLKIKHDAVTLAPAKIIFYRCQLGPRPRGSVLATVVSFAGSFGLRSRWHLLLPQPSPPSTPQAPLDQV